VGLWQRAHDRRYRQVIAAATPQLGTDEQVQTVLGISFNRWHTSATSIAMTGERVMFFTRDPLTGRLRDFVDVFPVEVVSLLEWTPTSRWSRLKLRRPDRELDLRVDRVHRDEAENIASRLDPR
jgi:hypothetical protein